MLVRPLEKDACTETMPTTTVFLLAHKAGQFRHVGHTKQSLSRRLRMYWQEAHDPNLTDRVARAGSHAQDVWSAMRNTASRDEWTIQPLAQVPSGVNPTECVNAARLDHGLVNQVVQLPAAADQAAHHTQLVEVLHAGTTAGTELTAEQQARLDQYHAFSMANATIRQYTAVAKGFVTWARTAFPGVTTQAQCTAQHVQAYLTEKAEAGLATSTLSTTVAGLRKVLPDIDWAAVNHTLTCIKRARAGLEEFEPHGKDPLLAVHLAQVLATITGTDIESTRNRVCLSTMWYSALRRSELAALKWRDVVFDQAGVSLHVRKAKGDQTGRGAAVPLMSKPKDPTRCPVKALRDWQAMLQPAALTQPVFPHIHPYSHGIMRDCSMGADRMYALVKAACAAAGLDPARYSCHSFRAGVLTEAANRGVPLHQLQKAARHVNVTTTSRYVRTEQYAQDSVAANV